MRIAKVNQNYFETIDTQDKAYFLGLIFADGCVHVNKQGYMHMSLGLIDQHIIETFKKYVESDIKIECFSVGEKGGFESNYPFYNIRINNKNFCQHLINHGCVPRKSLILKFPSTVPDHLMHHFIRGLFDGDGSITKGISGRHYHPQYSWMVYGTFDICDNINKIMNKEINCPLNKTKPRKNIFCYRLEGNQQLRRIYNYIYKDYNPELCLIRKHQKFMELFKIVPYSNVRK